MAHVEGTVESVIYNQGSFYILAIREATGTQTTVKGNIFGVRHISRGVCLSVQGRWVKNNRYGKQVSIQNWALPKRPLKGVVARTLEILYGFDPIVAQTLAETYGEGTFEALKHPLKVQEDHQDLLALSEYLARWEHLNSVHDLSVLLRDGGLTSTEIERAVLKFGSEAPKIVGENPYRLMEIPGFSFKRVDSLAYSLDFGPDNPQRLEGAILWALHDYARSGHLYMKRGDIPTKAAEVEASLPLPLQDTADQGFGPAQDRLLERGALVVDPRCGVYLPEYFEYERTSAKCLGKMAAASSIDIDLEAFLEEFQRSSQLSLSDAQQDAVRSLIQHKVLVLTGLPGTGKTMAVRALVRLFEVSRVSFVLLAPTGIAAKRLSHVTGQPASTIHRALQYDGSKWGFDDRNKYVVDAVIVDETSMVDQELLYRLLTALRDDTMVVLVGDDAQLPSVGPGNVLRELAACEALSRVRLTQIFRQSVKGDIVLNSHRINRGELPILGDPKGTSEFRFLPISNESQAQQAIVRMAAKLKERDANFQVLSPKYAGDVGVDALNRSLREVLNPAGGPEWCGNTQNFREGDRLMVVKNNYKLGVYNGDVGKLLHFGAGKLIVRIYGIGNEVDMEVAFSEAEADDVLRLAYAITVHKSQGSEFDTVILPVFQSQSRMLQRNLLYTAVTRAKKRVWLVGQESAIQRAIENNRVRQRNTALGAAVAGVLGNPDV